MLWLIGGLIWLVILILIWAFVYVGTRGEGDMQEGEGTCSRE